MEAEDDGAEARHAREVCNVITWSGRQRFHTQTRRSEIGRVGFLRSFPRSTHTVILQWVGRQELVQVAKAKVELILCGYRDAAQCSSAFVCGQTALCCMLRTLALVRAREGGRNVLRTICRLCQHGEGLGELTTTGSTHGWSGVSLHDAYAGRAAVSLTGII
jgi:hypothetical protein